MQAKKKKKKMHVHILIQVQEWCPWNDLAYNNSVQVSDFNTVNDAKHRPVHREVCGMHGMTWKPQDELWGTGLIYQLIKTVLWDEQLKATVIEYQ